MVCGAPILVGIDFGTTFSGYEKCLQPVKCLLLNSLPELLGRLMGLMTKLKSYQLGQAVVTVSDAEIIGIIRFKLQ